MKIVVFGLGAIGTVYATLLKAAGHEVYGVTKTKYLSKLYDKKVKITGIWSEIETKLDGVFDNCHTLRDRDLDLIILTVKAFDTKTAIEEIKSIIGKRTVVLLAQNGYGNYEIAKSFLGAEKVLMGRVIFGAKLLNPAHAEVTVIADDVVIGQPDRAIEEEVIQGFVNIMNNAKIPTKFSEEVYTILWDKIIYNAALNPLGALLECSYGTLASCDETKTIMNIIIDEIFTVCGAAKIKLRWENSEQYKEHFYNVLIPPTKAHYPSMYYDLKSGKKTEIDALNGAVVLIGNKYNVNTPANDFITKMIKAKERLSFLGE